MIEHPLSRIEIKILFVVFALLLIGVGAAYVLRSEKSPPPVAAKAPPPPEQKLTAGWHLIKMQRGDRQTLEIVSCDDNLKCTTTGYSFDPEDKRDIRRAEETYESLAHPPINKLIEVIK